MNSYPTTYTDAQKHSYEYWSNKPVKQLNCKSNKTGYIDRDCVCKKPYVNDAPIKLDNLEWKNVDVNNNNELEKFTNFINKYYLVESDVKFKPRYHTEFVKWVLHPFEHEILTLNYQNSIIGTVAYSLKNMVIENNYTKVGEVNFLCVHPKYRKDSKQNISAGANKMNRKYMVHSLIDEVARRINKKGCMIGIFATNKYVPTPTSVIRTYYRPLNYRKLFKHKFTLVPGDTEHIHKRFTDTVNPLDAYQEATKEHIPKILELYNEFVDYCNIYVKYTKDELEKILFSPCVKTYVIMGGSGIVDFVSYFIKEQEVIGTDENIKITQLFLYSCNKEDVNVMVANTIRLAIKDVSPDVFYATDICKNSEFLLSNKFMPDEDSDQDDYDRSYDHKFMKSSEKMYTNFFNFTTPQIHTSQVFLISF